MTARAQAGPFEDGVAAYEKQEFATALALWLPLAQQGHRAAQFDVAVLYEKGLGVAQDPAEAARWYLKAAQQGDTEAQFDVGVLYETGKGVAKDVEEARKWYRAAMANPSTDAEILKIKQRARARLASLTTETEDVITYTGGRFVIARSTDGACVVALQGEVTTSAISWFDDVVRKAAGLGCDKPWLLLESPGGLLFEGLDLGLKVRRAGFRTITRSACASACALIFLGGTERILVGSRAKIGLHQPARGSMRNRVCDPTTYSSSTTETLAYLKSVIPAEADQIMSLIMQTPCEGMEWVYGQRAVTLGIATSLEWQGIEVGPTRRAQSR
jgi:ATP-dependent protease ClpP protease subunit